MNTYLELYKVFYEVVKYKNISKTAESMYLSQSAITQSIQKLENILGGKVFYRNKNGVELTEEGKNLYEYIKDSIETINNAENIFSKYINLEKGKIRIGGGNSLISSLILEPLLEFINEYPKLNISINNGMTDKLIKKLLNGELDIVVLNHNYKHLNHSNIQIIPLKKSKFCFFASKKYIKEHPITKFKEIENHTLIVPKSPSTRWKILEDLCNKENLLLNANYEIANTSIMKKFVLKDIGIGFNNIENLKDINDKIVIIKEFEIENNMEGIATLEKNMCNQATLELVKKIKHYYN